jgi:sec-independent protein translocase protein TatA
MGSLSPIHWIIVLVVVLLLFGPARLAGVGKGLGEGIRSFKKGLGDDPPQENDTDAQKQLPKVDGKDAPDTKARDTKQA